MKYTDQEIYSKIVSVMEELFEIPANEVKLESRISEDLDLDSIDAIDLITELQNFIGHRIQPEQFKNVRTVIDIVKASQRVLSDIENESKTQQRTSV